MLRSIRLLGGGAMLEHALVTDATGSLLKQHPKTRSTDWDEVQDFCRRVYMPYRVRPLERKAKPDATLISRAVGRVIFSRFSYGTGIHLDNFDPEAGNILILNTLRGGLRHQAQQGDASTGAGESYVVDCSRTDYWLEGNDQHMQLNLTVPHDLMEEVAERWYGFVPDDLLWTQRVKFGGTGSRWLHLLDYVTRSIAPGLPQPRGRDFERHLEELVCVELLREWAAGAAFPLEHGARAAAPGYVRRAEEILSAEAREAPSIGDVAARLAISARTLSEGFRQFRGVTPRGFLAARRLEGLRRDLERAPAHLTVADIAGDWGFLNLGALAGKYRERFGELPSQTRARARRRQS